jgi:hypothetical protein
MFGLRPSSGVLELTKELIKGVRIDKRIDKGNKK